jgi:hypothetical protein
MGNLNNATILQRLDKNPLIPWKPLNPKNLIRDSRTEIKIEKIESLISHPPYSVVEGRRSRRLANGCAPLSLELLAE